MKKLYAFIITCALLAGFTSVHAQSTNTTPPCELVLNIRQDSNYHFFDLWAQTIVNSHLTTDSTITVNWLLDDSLLGTRAFLPEQYLPGGNHLLTAQMTTASGCHAQAYATIDVIQTCATAASFTYQADSINPLLVRFTASPDNDSASYFWNFFYNLSPITGKDQVYQFPAAQVYYVSLKMIVHSGTDSCRSIVSQSVYVNTIPDTCAASFTAIPNPQRPNQVSFSVPDSSSYDSVSWWMVKGTDSLNVLSFKGRSFTYLFPDTGCYTIAVNTFGRTCGGYGSQIICIDSIAAVPDGFIAAYPNPITSQANLDLSLPDADKVTIRIFSSMGKEMQTSNLAGYKGVNHISLSAADLPAGIYFIQLEYGTTIRRSRFVKL